ncbi:hypothetical protein EXIGLDRAFT_837261 [Exidia glandulosa HHB12029]|uniref:Uncharacterized protein n=1 Tax=Exidia glandulosa HHB12029 TaxID=1314781 RepID=A0A165GZA7_EXIGL|nr:hypothetical protein EXIGLDRAFT_837261 [Exidia glandulosa HHB12029]
MTSKLQRPAVLVCSHDAGIMKAEVEDSSQQRVNSSTIAIASEGNNVGARMDMLSFLRAIATSRRIALFVAQAKPQSLRTRTPASIARCASTSYAYEAVKDVSADAKAHGVYGEHARFVEKQEMEGADKPSFSYGITRPTPTIRRALARPRRLARQGTVPLRTPIQHQDDTVWRLCVQARVATSWGHYNVSLSILAFG